MKVRTRGLSPKVVADFVVTVGGFLLTTYGAGLDPVLSAGIAKALGTLAGIKAGPGHVVLTEESDDARLTAENPDLEL